MNPNIKQNSSKLHYRGACGSRENQRDAAGAESGPRPDAAAWMPSALRALAAFGRRALQPALPMLLAGMMMSGMPAPSHAQDESAAADVLEEVRVTGYRKSLEDSIGIKAQSDLIVEAVSAEDFGKLPDTSIAEALARLPGLAAQRLRGRAQVISVRGLSPDFTTALLNGREQVSVGDNRGVEFDQYPSELISAALVYKTPDASLIGQGLAGTTDLQTVRPLSRDGRTMLANLRYEWNDYSARNADGDDAGTRLNFFYIDQFADETIGLALGLSSLSNTGQGEEFRSWGYPDLNTFVRLPSGTDDTDPSDDEIVPFHLGNLLGGVDNRVRSSELERTSLAATLEWAPNDSMAATLDLYYSKFEETQLLRGFEYGLVWGGGTLDADSLPPANGGTASAASYDNARVMLRNDIESRDSDLLSFSLRFETELAGWNAKADVSQSGVDRDDEIVESYSGINSHHGASRVVTAADGSMRTIDAPNETISYTYDTQGIVDLNHENDYSNPGLLVLADVHGWNNGAGACSGTGEDRVCSSQAGYLNRPSIEDTLTQLNYSMAKDRDGWLSGMEFGAHFSSREKTKEVNEFILTFGEDASGNPILHKPFPSNGFVTSLGFSGIDGIASYDPRGLLNGGANGYVLERNNHADVTEKSWQVEEETVLLYAKFDMDTEWNGVPLTGNFGLQVASTDQESNSLGATTVGDALVTAPVGGGESYTELLPSGVLTLRLDEGHFLRFAMARTLARPRMDEMRASRQYTYLAGRRESTDINNSPWSGQGGNPQISPWIAHSLDLSYERYLADNSGYVALALFYKDLKSYIYTANLPFDFSPFLASVGANTEATRPALTTGFLSVPENGSGGEISGIEFALTVNGDAIHESLSDWGANFNATINDSAVTADPAGTTEINLPGLSKKLWNLTLFYERGGFEARASIRHRSKFISEIQGFGAGREFRQARGESIVDAHLGYRFAEDSALDGLSFFLQGNNLRDEPFATYDDGGVREYNETGATYTLGLSYLY